MIDKVPPFIWDAITYDYVSNVQEKWAKSLIKKKVWNGCEKVLDAGCGSGRVTKILSRYLPNGIIYGIDADPNMIRKAKENLSGFHNVLLYQKNLTSITSGFFPIKFDIVFSNAVLHWVQDHYIVFKNFYKILDKDGELLIQCGGLGNLKNTIAVFNTIKDSSEFIGYFSNWKISWNFAKPVDTINILREIGYKNIDVYLTDTPVSFHNRSEYSIYLKTIVLGPYLAHLPNKQLKEKFLNKVLEKIENECSYLKWNLDYVRLNIFASV